MVIGELLQQTHARSYANDRQQNANEAWCQVAEISQQTQQKNKERMMNASACTFIQFANNVFKRLNVKPLHRAHRNVISQRSLSLSVLA
jgi:hypothetical protein